MDDETSTGRKATDSQPKITQARLGGVQTHLKGKKLQESLDARATLTGNHTVFLLEFGTGITLPFPGRWQTCPQPGHRYRYLGSFSSQTLVLDPAFTPGDAGFRHTEASWEVTQLGGPKMTQIRQGAPLYTHLKCGFWTKPDLSLSSAGVGGTQATTNTLWLLDHGTRAPAWAKPPRMNMKRLPPGQTGLSTEARMVLVREAPGLLATKECWTESPWTMSILPPASQSIPILQRCAIDRQRGGVVPRYLINAL